MSKRFKKKYLFIAVPVVLLAFALLRPNANTGDEIAIQQIENGNLEFSISSSGQVTSNQSVNLQPQGSGPVTQIFTKEGARVERGQLLLSLETTDQGVNLRNAELDLESAQIELMKMTEPASESDQKQAENELLRAENDLVQRQTQHELDVKNQERTITNLEEDIPDSYEDAFNTVASIFVDLPDALSDLENIMEAKTYNSSQVDPSYYANYLDSDESTEQKDRLEESYRTAVNAYEDALQLYQETSRSETDALPELTQITYDAVNKLSTALKEMDIFLAMVYEDFPSNHPNNALDAQRAVLRENISTINPHLSSIYDEIQIVDDLNDDIEEARDELTDLITLYESDLKELQLSIDEKESALEDLKEGADSKEIRQQQIQVEKRSNSLQSAQKAYNDQFIYAPFAGIITSVGVDLGESASNASIAFTLVSEEKLIEVNLNEIDVSQVKVGQRGTARFDSFPDEVVNVELAFVSELNEPESNVVEYKAHFTLATHSLDLKEGMSVEVNLILDQKENVILIPRLALIQEEGQTYVEVAENVSGDYKENTLYNRAEFIITRVPVNIGLSNAESIEAIEGLETGDWVILQPSTAVAAPEDPFGPPPEVQDEASRK